MTQNFDKQKFQETLNEGLKLLRAKEYGEIIPTFGEKVMSIIGKHKKTLLKTALLAGASAAGLAYGMDIGAAYVNQILEGISPVTNAMETVANGLGSVVNGIGKIPVIGSQDLCTQMQTSVGEMVQNTAGVPAQIKNALLGPVQTIGGAGGAILGYSAGKIGLATANALTPTSKDKKGKQSAQEPDYKQQYAFTSRMKHLLKEVKGMMIHPEALQMRDADGNTIVDYVVEMKDLQMIQKLKKAGANFDCENKDGITPRKRLEKLIQDPNKINELIGKNTDKAAARQQRDAEMQAQTAHPNTPITGQNNRINPFKMRETTLASR